MQGRGLVSSTHFQKDDIILEERPLVSSQFSWNELYKYQACEYCLRSIETAESMARRLSNNESLALSHPECCDVDLSQISPCPQCQVLNVILTYISDMLIFTSCWLRNYSKFSHSVFDWQWYTDFHFRNFDHRFKIVFTLEFGSSLLISEASSCRPNDRITIHINAIKLLISIGVPRSEYNYTITQIWSKIVKNGLLFGLLKEFLKLWTLLLFIYLLF